MPDKFAVDKEQLQVIIIIYEKTMKKRSRQIPPPREKNPQAARFFRIWCC